MARQAHILSYDEARRSAASRRAATTPARSSARSAHRAAGSVSTRSSRSSRSSYSSRVAGSARPVAAGHGASAAAVAKPAMPSMPAMPSWLQSTFDAQESGRSASRAQGSARRSAQSTPRPAMEQLHAEEPTRKRGGLLSKAESLKSTRSKAKAEKQFNKQYMDGASASASDAGPRAAVYRGEMGTQHKRAARMQDTAETGRRSSSTVKKKRSIAHNPFVIIATAAVACVVFACAFLYPTAQQYYLSVRQHDKLEAEYQAVSDRNQELQDQLTSLSSEEGLKQYVHEQYGWISEGDNAVVVQGLTDESENGLSGIAANVVPGSVQAPDTWYSDVLDPFFGYTQ